MTALAEKLRRKYFKEEHPYRIFESEVERYLRQGWTLLDAGCGRTAPVLSAYKDKAERLIGVDLVEFAPGLAGMQFLRSNLAEMPLESESVDLAMSRAVMEHLTDPASVYREIGRVLKPGGYFIFLTANLWDYASVVAKLIPNRLHPWIVARTEGRAEQDVFPVAYRTNTRHAVRKWAAQTGFEIICFRYLGQYPGYFMFNGLLFLAATGYQKLASKIPALNCLQGWIMVTLRKSDHWARTKSGDKRVLDAWIADSEGAGGA